MLASVIAASIVIRFGLIEALLRFYYLAGEDPRAGRSRPASRRCSGPRPLAARSALAFAGADLEALLDRPDAELGAARGPRALDADPVGVRAHPAALDERARAYFTLTVLNVLATIPVTVWLVVVEDEGAPGILLGSFGTGAVFLAWLLWRERRRLSLRPDRPLLRRMVRFGLPTMPAELSLYSLNFIDRILIVRLAGLAEAGLYALAIKFAQGMNVLAAASSSPSRRSPTRSPTTTRPGAPTA